VKGNFVIGCVRVGFLGGLLGGIPALAADSILAPQPGPCAAALERPDYVPGVDANGQSVVRADLGAEHTSVPDQVFVPLPNRGGRGGRAGPLPGTPVQGPYAAIDSRRLDPLINPKPCDAPDPARPAAPKAR